MFETNRRISYLLSGEENYQENKEEKEFRLQTEKELELWDEKFQEYLNSEYYFIEFLKKVKNDNGSKYFIVICDINMNDIDESNVNCLKNARNFWYNIQLTKNKQCESVFCLQYFQTFKFNVVLIVKNQQIIKCKYVCDGNLITLNQNESFMYQP